MLKFPSSWSLTKSPEIVSGIKWTILNNTLICDAPQILQLRIVHFIYSEKLQPKGKLTIECDEAGNSENTIAFLKYLLSQCPESRIALIWDGASYHRSDEVKAYLASVNQGLDESNWKITCIRFAPNAPQQNPIEDIWLIALRFIRECYHLCKSFGVVKYLFEFIIHQQIFNFPKLFTYGYFSQVI